MWLPTQLNFLGTYIQQERSLSLHARRGQGGSHEIQFSPCFVETTVKNPGRGVREAIGEYMREGEW